MSQFKFGLSVPAGYIASSITEEDPDYIWYQMYGPSSECLSQLKELGVGWIEFDKLGPRLGGDQLIKAIHKVRDAGLHATFHWTSLALKKEPFPSFLQDGAREISLQGHDLSSVPAPIHGYIPTPFPSKEKAIEKTVKELDFLCKELKEGNSALILALENCRSKEGGPVGITLKEVSSIISQMEETNIGLCWDLGHTWYNHLSLGWDVYPPEDVLSEVIHTHIHDLREDRSTHSPLGRGETPIKEYITMLAKSNYQGIYSLEFLPERWDEEPEERRKGINESIKRLMEIVYEVSSS